MRIAIIGCGWVGNRLVKFLTEKDHQVIATTTSSEKIPELQSLGAEVHLLDFGKNYKQDFLKSADVAIFSMPISRDSWFEGFKKLESTFPKTLLFSSTGIYPLKNGIFTEDDEYDLRSDILVAENVVLDKFPQTTVLRFGGLMGDERSLQNFFSRKKPPHPEKKVNYVHYADILPIVELFLTSEPHHKFYNIVAPEHPAIGEILNIETEGKSAQPDDVNDRIVSSRRLIQEFNYTFIHPNPKYF
ncbi:MAG: NAD-binding protein [Weeksellaceae bacterium]|nr:NAD-binding protein [Weeksellaceae bacterium]